ncbi:MAG: hypothetical protein CL484_06745 [Acidobacteria bacterium]|nr:hypothetical protein [Acidobacteriota bacterium]
MVFLKRSADVACLKHSVFEAIAADTGATLQAVMVVIIAAWSGFIGTLLAGGASITVAQLLTGTMFVIPILALGNTGLSCSLAYLVGIRLSGGTLSAVNTTQDIIETHYSAGSHQPLESSPSIGAVFRVIGFTQVPDSLGFLLGIPYVGGVAGIVLAVWGLCVLRWIGSSRYHKDTSPRDLGNQLVGSWAATIFVAVHRPSSMSQSAGR